MPEADRFDLEALLDHARTFHRTSRITDVRTPWGIVAQCVTPETKDAQRASVYVIVGYGFSSLEQAALFLMAESHMADVAGRPVRGIGTVYMFSEFVHAMLIGAVK